jgi:lipoprotein-releasing system permease protein
MLPFKLAVRFLKSGRGQTILIIAGIAVAIAAQIFIGLLISSLQKTLVNRTVGNQPQITITSATDKATIQDWQRTVNQIQQSGLTEVTAATASGNAFIQKGSKNAPVVVRGFDSQADRIYDLNSRVYAGIWNSNQNGILMGKDLQEQLGYNIGDNVDITVPQGKSTTYQINGFFDLGIQQLNQTWIISSLNTSQSLFGYDNGVTAIEMTVNDFFQADTIASQLQSTLNDSDLSITNWKTQNTQLLSGLQGQSISSLMIQIFIVLAVVIAIAAILAITVYQKSRQLGILKAMGIKDRSASLIFIFEGLIIGLIGAVAGVLLGLGLFYGFSIGTTKPGEPALIEAFIDYRFIAISWVIAVASAVLAALIPARRSLRLNPIDVIREG